MRIGTGDSIVVGLAGPLVTVDATQDVDDGSITCGYHISPAQARQLARRLERYAGHAEKNGPIRREDPIPY